MPESAAGEKPNSLESNVEPQRDQADRQRDHGRQRIEAFSQIDRLCGQSRFVDALTLGTHLFGDDLRQWTGTQGRLSAAKLAQNLGGNQLGEALIFRLGREHADHPEVILLRTWQRIGRCPLARLWIDIKDASLPTDDSLIQAKWLGLKGRILTCMRDFDRAFEVFDEAIRLAPDTPGPRLNLADAWSEFDDIDAAVLCCRDALEIAPRDSSTVQRLTHYLLQSNQIDEAFQLMTELVNKTQSGSGRLQLAQMLIQRKQFDQAAQLTSDIQRFFPLADPLRFGKPKPGSVHSAIAALQSDLAYHAGDTSTSISFADLAGGKYYKAISKNLAQQSGDAKRVQLDVPFTLQKHVTCAPATLTMLSGFWDINVDHDAVVDEICYNGTSPVKQRMWATDNGMIAKEFRVTFESAKALIDAGIPFGLSTIAPGMGHIQVVCGYDSRRGVLLIQDPGIWCVREELPSKMIDDHRAFGPRGLVLIPEGKDSILESIELPECDAFDQQYEIAVALEKFDRESAAKIVADMQTESPADCMTLWAEIDLARYDSNVPAQLDLVRKLLERFPDNDVLWLWETDLMKLIDRPDVVTERLRESVQQGRALSATRLGLIDLLADDINRSEREGLLRAVLRDSPMSSSGLQFEANRLWDEKRFEDALELFRLAAMSSELDEGHASDYLIASKRLERHHEVLEVLQRRFQEHGASSHRPGITYALALDDAMRSDEAVAVIREALSKRPDDAELICQAAHFLGRMETPDVGLKLLDSSTITLPEQDELRSRAILAGYDGRPEDALKNYMELGVKQPLNPGLSDQIASLLVELKGFDDAVDYLTNLTERFPHCRSLLASTARMMHAAARYPDAIAYVDRMLVAYYNDGWCWQERSILDARCDWQDQSLEDAEQAVKCDRSAASLTVRGEARVRVHRDVAAKEDFRKAILMDCDYGPAIAAWMMVCHDAEERSEVLNFVYLQLIEQRTDGSGLAAYYDFASPTLDPTELTKRLLTVCEMRPDSYAAWMLLATHYTHFRQNEDAEQLLLEKEQRFGSRPGYWVQLGELYTIEDESEKAIQAYQRGLELHPHHSDLSRNLASCYREADRKEDARKVLRRALQGAPADASLMVALAQSIDDNEEAKTLATNAAMRASSASSAWSFLLEICQKCGRESDAVDAARELVRMRPHDVNSHLRLAEMLHREDQWEDSLNVIADAMKIDRRQAEIHYLFARRLFERRYNEKALEACSPPEVDPSDLQALRVFSTRILYATGEQEMACQTLREALRRDPTDIDSWICLANWSEEMSQFKWYDEASTALYRRAGHLAISHVLYASTLVRRNRPERAAEHLQYALELDHKFESALCQYMVLMINSHKLTEAEKYLDKIANKIPTRMLALGRLLIAAATDDVEDFFTTMLCLPKDENGKNDQEEIAAIVCQYLNSDRVPNFTVRATKEIKKRRPNKAIGYMWAHFHSSAENFQVGLNRFLKLRRSDGRNTAAEVLLNVLHAASESGDAETAHYAHSKTNAILRRLGNDVYKDATLWSHAIWTLLGQGQNKRAAALAKKFRKVKDRDVEGTVPAMLAAFYAKDLKSTRAMLDAAQGMPPEKMTEECRMIRAMYSVFDGTDEEVESSIRLVNKNELTGAFLRASKLITAGVESLQAKDPAALMKMWKVEFFRTHNDDDPIDLRIYQLLRSRIAKARGEKREAKKWYKGKKTQD